MQEEYLTVKEFAAAAGVSTQRIYKAMKTTLQPYIANTENGATMLHCDGLREFGINHSLQLCNDVLQTESCKAQTRTGSETTENEHSKNTQACNDVLQTALIDELRAQIDELRADKEHMKEQLRSKDAQIATLTTALDNVTAALTTAQALHAGTIQQTLIENKAEPSTAPTSSEDAPAQSSDSSGQGKKGFWARIFGRGRS